MVKHQACVGKTQCEITEGSAQAQEVYSKDAVEDLPGPFKNKNMPAWRSSKREEPTVYQDNYQANQQEKVRPNPFTKLIRRGGKAGHRGGSRV